MQYEFKELKTRMSCYGAKQRSKLVIGGYKSVKLTRPEITNTEIRGLVRTEVQFWGGG
jgi:hypothetical protein